MHPRYKVWGTSLNTNFVQRLGKLAGCVKMALTSAATGLRKCNCCSVSFALKTLGWTCGGNQKSGCLEISKCVFFVWMCIQIFRIRKLTTWAFSDRDLVVILKYSIYSMYKYLKFIILHSLIFKKVFILFCSVRCKVRRLQFSIEVNSS